MDGERDIEGDPWFVAELSRDTWRTKYRWRDGDQPHESTVAETWARVARALASVERDPRYWQNAFYEALSGFKFLPGGRILAGAGTAHRVTLFNCFVMGIIDDSMDGIFDGLKEGAMTMQQGGGVGYDFSTLRPKGALARTTGTIASGPVSFMRIWNAMCGTILSTGARRGAMMATLRCDHPDIEDFISAKQRSGALTYFNLSVQVLDDFMEAVEADRDWQLVFPEAGLAPAGDEEPERVDKRWSGEDYPVPCRVLKTIPARALWNKIMKATYDHAEPGVLFVDRINEQNNLRYREHITATNPCGEIPLPPYGACDLGSVNLTQFVRRPFEGAAHLDMEGIQSLTRTAVRMMDNVIDLSRFPLEQQSETEHDKRRIGLGITGLADALIMLGLHYDSDAGRDKAAEVMRLICYTAYRSSVALAKEKGSFPAFAKELYLESPYVRALPQDVHREVAKHGIRNSHLTAIAPTGTISVLANTVSGGLEPVFDFEYQRQVLQLDGQYKKYHVTDYAYRVWTDHYGDRPLPETFVTAQELSPQAHLEMQAALQPYVDNSISKTIYVPEDYPFEDFRDVYRRAYEKGLKGCTTFRPNPVTGSVLEIDRGVESAHCCSLEREAD